MASINDSSIPVPPPLPATTLPVKEEVIVEPTLGTKVYNSAAAVLAPVGAAAGSAGHAVAEQTHRALESVQQSAAVAETAPASVRIGAAKSAIEHHNDALRHSALKEQKAEAAGLPAAAAKISETVAAIPETVTIAAKNTGEYISTGAKNTSEYLSSSAKTAASTTASTLTCGGHALAEKSHKAAEVTEQAAATSAVVPSQMRFAAATNALAHHQEADRHAAQKSADAEAAGLPALGAAIKSGYDTVATGAVNAYNSLVGTNAATAPEAPVSAQPAEIASGKA